VPGLAGRAGLPGRVRGHRGGQQQHRRHRDTRLTQGGDELDLLRRLQAAGEVVYDVTNPTRTSSRRLDEGLLNNVAVTFL